MRRNLRQGHIFNEDHLIMTPHPILFLTIVVVHHLTRDSVGVTLFRLDWEGVTPFHQDLDGLPHPLKVTIEIKLKGKLCNFYIKDEKFVRDQAVVWLCSLLLNREIKTS